MDVALNAEQVTVARGRTSLLKDFSLTLGRGELTHLVGPNGSGKTSLLRVLAGVVEPRRGTVKRTPPCAYVPQSIELPSSLLASRWLKVTRCQVVLPKDLARRCGELSKGQLQRMVMLAGLTDAARRPALILLDEPWAGLDQEHSAWLDENLASLARQGSSVLYTDHSGATTLVAGRSIKLGAMGQVKAPSPAAATIRLMRGDERVEVRVANSELVSLLNSGWSVDGADPAP